MFNRTRKGNALPFAGLSKGANTDAGEDKHDDVDHDKNWEGAGPTPKSVKLRLGIHFAENLVAADAHGTSDPLVKVYWHHKLVYTTSVKKLTINPKWEESVDLAIDWDTKLQYAQLRCEIYDRDLIGKDDFLGRVMVRMYEVITRYGNSTYILLTPTGPIQYKLKKRPKGDENLKVRGWLYLSYGLVDDFSDADSMVSIINDAEKKVNNDGADVSEFLKSVNWIAAVGQQDLAEKIANAVIAQTVDGKGEDSVAASTIRDLVGAQFKKCGKYQVSFEFHDRALLSRLRSFDDEGVADSYHYLGGLCAARGERKKAEANFVKAIEVRSRVYGNRCPKVAVSMNQLADLLKSANHLDRAEKAAGEAYGIMCDAYGDGSLAAANALTTLASILRRKGKQEVAFEMYESVLSARDERLGPHHSATAVALANLANAYRSRAKSDFNFHDEGLLLAQNTLRRCLTVKEHIYGRKSLKLATTLSNFSKLYSDTHDYERAEPVMQRAYDIRKEMLGEKHGDTLVTRSALASIVSHRGRLQEAKTMLLECLEDVVQYCGKDHPKTDKVFRNYVFTATEEGVHNLEIALGNREIVKQTVPPFRYIWERAYDWVKLKLGQCATAVKTKIATLLEKKKSEAELAELAYSADAPPDGEAAFKPNKNLGVTKMFDRPIVVSEEEKTIIAEKEKKIEATKEEKTVVDKEEKD